MAKFNFDSTYEELKPGRYSAKGGQNENFDSTYEELKLSSSFIIVPFLSHFDSTYEELKQLLFIKAYCQKENFDSTYEELKLKGVPVEASLHFYILTLPMRNWNDDKKDDLQKIIAEDFDSTYEELKLT